ncbi:hypothetical protein SLNWT_7078 [Streptomyces albus]|uniref:Uncharacterized protein n=1 Tax=Streptomyces albus (strain ATCC 21838 / DSM 41398 / FERM P-419 / JCM 4703 / NBRC 107858) TaxID=1081613 RepID=A0A0B5F050_STRA4|nr:hypothetical protein SLNWT_7078 [Streptomyces albus]AOU81757.1 hypothetical protein SLNHY_7066 [Streptomyces albus]AYN37446.1 hypothetical protein DUI70_6953 [Streptomyces albus]
MPLQATEFFAELRLPFHHHTVVGNTYYAAPIPNAPLRLRIDFSRTLHADAYGGLRVTVVHPDRGEIDAVILSFADHGTFHRRDEAANTQPNTRRYATFDKYHPAGRPPWDGADTTALRDAIEKYTVLWFPGASTTTTPGPASGHTPRSTPAPPTAPVGTRTR